MMRFVSRWFLGSMMWAPLSGAMAPCLMGETPPVPVLAAEEKAFLEAAEFAQPSVVQIETFGGREIVGDSAVASGPSTGTVVAADGWIVTSLFQFRGDPASITVLLPTGARQAARLVARDHARDLALLKIDIDEPLLPATPSPREEWRTGQWTIALGKTFDTVHASRSVGILSATDRIFGRAIQTDCKISPHNYGGPLIDIRGRVMGILAPIDPGIATEGEVQQWYDSGIGFAIPLDDVLRRLPKMKEGTDIHPGKAGIRPKVNDDFRGPVILAGVAPGTPAAQAGLKAGDRLLTVNGQEIRWPNHMRHALGGIDAGESVEMVVDRNGATRSVRCTLVRELPVYRVPFLGLRLAADEDGPGVRIAAVIKDGPAAKSGLGEGQVILKVGDEAIASREEFDRQMAFLDYRQPSRWTVAGEKEGEAEKVVEVQPSTWPDEGLPFDVTSSSSPAEESSPAPVDKKVTGIVPIVMGDVTNQVFALVPPTYTAEVPHGLLMIVPEPGKVEQKAWIDRWETFCRRHRYILAVVGSAQAEAWSMEEIEIFRRCWQQLRNDYTLDPRRLAVGGIGAGGTPAILFALQNRSSFRGLWLAGGTIPRGLRMPQSEPLESPTLLLQGEQPSYQAFREVLEKGGYRATVTSEKYDPAGAIQESAQRPVEAFLAALDWF